MTKPNKTDYCPNCCPDIKAAIHDRDFDDDGKPVWICQNCFHETPRRVTKSGTKLTASQVQAVACIQREAKRWGDEIKTLRLNLNEYGTLSVYCVSGCQGDEGTMLAVIGRYHWHIFVGRSGGLTSYKNSKPQRGRAALRNFHH